MLVSVYSVTKKKIKYKDFEHVLYTKNTEGKFHPLRPYISEDLAEIFNLKSIHPRSVVSTIRSLNAIIHLPYKISYVISAENITIIRLTTKTKKVNISVLFL